MTFREKIFKFKKKTGREASSYRTSILEIPFEYRFGSSSHSPDQVVKMQTSDIVLWCRFLNETWFRPYGSFDLKQILDMLEICKNDNQVVALMELLSAKKV